MDRRRVTSSSLAAIGYSMADAVLEVEFKHGPVYQYLSVPPGVFAAFLTAESKGTFFNQSVKDHYSFRRLTP
jgi:hypothetical protein